MFKMSSLYKYPELMYILQQLDAYNRSHSGWQTQFPKLDDDFCIVNLKNILRVHNKNRL